MSARSLPVGAKAAVKVPASSANLGPGFDSLSLALDLWDDYEVVTRPEPGIVVEAQGESANEVPNDETHLVARALLQGLAAFGALPESVGFRVTCVNRIPHGRGLGSSAAAIVGGVSLASGLLGDVAQADVLQVSTDLEGHPDNAAASLLGGFVISWMDGHRAHAVRGRIHPDVRAVLFVPETRSPTEAARRALPGVVAHADAAFNTARSALLVHAMAAAPELLNQATADTLHQEQRRGAYPAAMELVDRLRAASLPAVISGAGPSVLVLGTEGQCQEATEMAPAGFEVRPLDIAAGSSATGTIG